MGSKDHLDSKYYQAVPPRSLGERLTIAALCNLDVAVDCMSGTECSGHWSERLGY